MNVKCKTNNNVSSLNYIYIERERERERESKDKNDVLKSSKVLLSSRKKGKLLILQFGKSRIHIGKGLLCRQRGGMMDC